MFFYPVHREANTYTVLVVVQAASETSSLLLWRQRVTFPALGGGGDNTGDKWGGQGGVQLCIGCQRIGT